MIKKIDHIAVAVASIDEAAKFYEGQLGLKITLREHVPKRKVHVAFIPIGDTRIELVAPDSPDSPIAKFLEKHGPGLQHVCFETDDCGAELARLGEAGVRLIDAAPVVGAHGTKVGFVHPAASGGVLVELSQLSKEESHE